MIYRYIYRTINIKNGKSYIGQHTTKKEYDYYLGSGSKLNEDIKKYGRYIFLKGIIEYCNDKDDLNEKEKYWIEYYDTINNGYNICKGGGDFPILYGENNGFYNKKHSEETKKKISKSRKERDPWNKGLKGVQKASEHQKKVTSETHKGENNWNYGKKGILSQNYGLIRSQETKLKLSISKKGDKNPNICKFEIVAPDGKCFIADSGIPDFLETHTEYKIDKKFLYYAKRVGKYKGWKVIKIN